VHKPERSSARVIGEGLKLCLIGLALGLVGASWLGWAGSSLLFGVTATDPLTFVAVSLLLTGVATAACYFPARRAMMIEPIVALRQLVILDETIIGTVGGAMP